jgi:hypothetical protein
MELAQIDVLRFLITKTPGRTAEQLAHAIYGRRSAKEFVVRDLNILLMRGSIDRRGGGLRGYRYYPISA